MAWVGTYLLKLHSWYHGIAPIKASLGSAKAARLEVAAGTDTSPDDRKPRPLRLGVLGAANINYSAIIDSCATHPDAVIVAIAARSLDRARAQIEQYAPDLVPRPRALGSYDELLADPDIDAVYIPVPNGLHHRWALRTLAAGKHALIEKPLASNAREAREVRAAARRSGKVALEAVHWSFHPAGNTLKSLVDAEEFGPVRRVHTHMCFPRGLVPASDVQFDFSIGGGASMGLVYVYAVCAHLAAKDFGDPNVEFEVLEARARPDPRDPRIDEALDAKFIVRDRGRDVVCTTEADLRQPYLFGLIPRFWEPTCCVEVHTDRAVVFFDEFFAPWTHHAITITPVTRDTAGNILTRGKKEVRKAYAASPGWVDVDSAEDSSNSNNNKNTVKRELWTTYRYQLEAFVRRCRQVDAGTDPNGPVEGMPWCNLDESVKVMEVVDAVYQKAGLPERGIVDT